MGNLQDRIKKVLADAGMTHEEMARETGVSATRIGNMTRGTVKNMRTDEAEAIQRRYGWRAAWLMDGRGAQRLTKEERALLCGDAAPLTALAQAQRLIATEPDMSDSVKGLVRQAMVLSAGGRHDELGEVLLSLARLRTHEDALGYIEVPRYDVAASAGGGAVIHDETVVDYLAFRRDWIVREMGLDAKHLALITVRGDSMFGTINNGDLVLLDTRPGAGFSDGIYVIQLRGALLCKRLHMRLTGVVDVMSDNPAYKTETVSAEELERLTIVGRVVWHGRRI